jgi:hypothetical protein
VRESYSQPALVPASPWLARPEFATPDIRIFTDSASGDRVLELQPGILNQLVADMPASRVWLWVVQKRTPLGWTTQILPGSDVRYLLGGGSLPLDIRITAIDRVGNASPVARLIPPL